MLSTSSAQHIPRMGLSMPPVRQPVKCVNEITHRKVTIIPKKKNTVKTEITEITAKKSKVSLILESPKESGPLSVHA